MGKHIHKYRRIDIGRDKPYYVMQCGLHGCKHYTPMPTRESCPALVGKLSICNKCGDQFELTRKALISAKPICNGCIKSKKKKQIESAKNFLDFIAEKEGLDI